MRHTCLAAGFVSLALFASLAQAQSTAQINGTVRDAAGLAVPGSEIKVTQTATGLIRTATSGVDGAYTLTNLPIGPYVVEVSKEGFSKYVQSGIVLQVDSNPTIDAALKVGSVSDQITVQADATMVETHATGVGQVVDSQRVVEMPLNGRNATELIFLAGMANAAPGTGSISSVRNYPTILISVAGGIPNGVTYQLDGANYNDSYNHLNLPLPFPDALQEFKVETGALSAQYGSHSAAAVNAVTKSGTNAFHGDAFDFFRNGDLNARDFFAPARDTLRRNQFGGTLGGPIKKDKLFFFLGYQGTEQRSDPGQAIAYVPTAAMRNGDFTGVTSPPCNSGKQITLPASAGFAGSIIAASRLNPAALKFAAGLPIPSDPCGKVQYGLLNDSTEHLSLVKVDYQLNEKQSIFGRAYVALLDIPTTFDGKNLLTANTAASHYRSASLVLGHTWLLTSSVVNSFRVGANRVDAPKISDNYGSWQSYGVNALSFIANNPQISVGGNGFTIGGGSDIVGLANTGPNYNVVDDVSWLKGSHQFGFGANIEHELLNSKTGVNLAGTATFSGQALTGLSQADFLLGAASAWKQGGLGQYWDRSYDMALYVQDAWKITPRLLLSYGLRWEPFTPPYSKFGWFDHFLQSNFNNGTHSMVYPNAPAGLIFPGDSQWTSGNSIANNRFKQFLPRVGVVFDPKGDGKMTIRASYGRFVDRINLLGFTAYGQNAPWGSSLTLGAVNLSQPWAAFPGGNSPLPIPLTAPFNNFSAAASFPQDWRPTTVDSWNFSVQRQFGSDWLLTANYVGNHIIHLVTAGNVNPAQYYGLGPCTLNGPSGSVSYASCSTTANTNQRRVLYQQNPAQGQLYAVVGTLDDGGTGSYNAGYLAVQKRLSKGASVLANYTLSHCISDLWNAFPGNTGSSSITPGDRHHERSNCSGSDQRQVFNLSAVVQSPKFSNNMLRWLASDWQLSPVMKIKSSQFYTVTTGIDNALSGEGSQRPNLGNAASIYPANQTVSSWMNPVAAGAFTSPAPGTYGNLGAFNLRGPGVFQLDTSLARTFRIREKQTLQLRVEAFNLPNHLNPSIPVAATNSPAFGQIQSDISGTSGLLAGDPRIVQVALKILF